MSKTILKGETNRATKADVSIAVPSATVAQTGGQVCDATCPSNQQPANDCEETIRARAHSKWEAAGCPPGDGFDIWLEAEREVNAERTGSSSAQG